VSTGQCLAHNNIEIVDFPGIYSLTPISEEEQVAVEAFHHSLNDPEYHAYVCVLDSTRLEKALFFAQQIINACQTHNKPVILAANMADVLASNKLSFDSDGLSKALGAPVIPLSAKTGKGLSELIAAFDAPYSASSQIEHHQHEPLIIARDDASLRNKANALAQQFGPKGDLLLKTQTTLDRLFLRSVSGGISFFVIMYLLFQSIFTWAAPLMDGVETLLGFSAEAVLPLLPSGMARDFAEDAIFGGVGAFLVFVPQIFILTLIIGILEDSGYLARAAVICHKPLRFFGLTGKSFIPMLSGVACAIPGIYAARTVESKRKRWLTYMAVPLMPCAARLPVYTLLIAAFIPSHAIAGGLLGLQGLAMFGVYLFGIICGLLVTAAVSSTSKSLRDDLPFVLEMPPYRLPSWQPLLRNAWQRGMHFVREAGPIIFVVSVVVWALGYFPNHGSDLGSSWLGQLGRWIEPVFKPLGLDWQYGVAILTSFLAREVFVGTLGTLFGIANSEDDISSLSEQIQASGLPLASGVALLVFFAIAMQCVSTLATLARESRSWRLPIQLFVAYSFLAYGLAWLTYQLII
ncbi:ferrous iron transporter B, partial [bacterium]|nr:ferrous iron transporter B [bacterium]